MADETSISARTIDALTAIAEGLREVTAAYREMGRAAEAQIAAQETAGEPAAPSGGVGTSETLSGRLRAAADYQDRPGAYDELRAMADEVDVLVDDLRFTADRANLSEQSYANLMKDWVIKRDQVEAIRAAITREAAHGEAITRCNLVAERFQTVLDSVTAP